MRLRWHKKSPPPPAALSTYPKLEKASSIASSTTLACPSSFVLPPLKTAVNESLLEHLTTLQYLLQSRKSFKQNNPTRFDDDIENATEEVIRVIKAESGKWSSADYAHLLPKLVDARSELMKADLDTAKLDQCLWKEFRLLEDVTREKMIGCGAWKREKGRYWASVMIWPPLDSAPTEIGMLKQVDEVKKRKGYYIVLRRNTQGCELGWGRKKLY